MLIWMILILLGIAHEEEGACDPFPMMERKAATGGLTHEIEECLQRKVESPLVAENQRWVLWIGRWRAGGSIADRNKQARALLKTSQLPDRALWLAQTVAKDDPKLALEALERAEALAHKWTRFSRRIEQLHVLFSLKTTLSPESAPIRWSQLWVSMGIAGPYLQEALAACTKVADEKTCRSPRDPSFLTPGKHDNWKACSNSLHLWNQRFGKRAYSTERDCLIHAAYFMEPGEAKERMIRWALLLALSRDEAHVTSAAMRLFAPSLRVDPKAILVAADFHRKQGDKAGAQWWESQAH